jgi:hypothetical protein
VIEAESGARVVCHAHERRADQPFDRAFVSFDDNIGDLSVSKEVEDVGRGIANSTGFGGFGTNCNPHNLWPKCLLPIHDAREAGSLERRVLEPVGLHRCQNLGSDDIPHVVERLVEDRVGSLGGDLEEARSRLRDREGVGVKIGTPQEFRWVFGDTMIPKVTLVLGDQVRGDGGRGRSISAELRKGGLREWEEWQRLVPESGTCA